GEFRNRDDLGEFGVVCAAAGDKIITDQHTSQHLVPTMQVVVLYNEPVLPVDHPDADSEHEIVFTVDTVVGHLTDAGLDVSRLAVSREPSALLSGLRRRKPDVVFNLFEGLADHCGTEAYAAGLLEWLGIPYTGCPFQTLCIARDKPWTKRLL